MYLGKKNNRFVLFFPSSMITVVCYFLFLIKNTSMVPKKVFFTKGVGVHKDKLASFELALRKA